MSSSRSACSTSSWSCLFSGIVLYSRARRRFCRTAWWSMREPKAIVKAAGRRHGGALAAKRALSERASSTAAPRGSRRGFGGSAARRGAWRRRPGPSRGASTRLSSQGDERCRCGVGMRAATSSPSSFSGWKGLSGAPLKSAAPQSRSPRRRRAAAAASAAIRRTETRRPTRSSTATRTAGRASWSAGVPSGAVASRSFWRRCGASTMRKRMTSRSCRLAEQSSCGHGPSPARVPGRQSMKSDRSSHAQAHGYSFATRRSAPSGKGFSAAAGSASSMMARRPRSLWPLRSSRCSGR